MGSSIETIELIQNACYDCESLLMDGNFIIPISLKENQLSHKGSREYVDITDHVFEEDK
tara:strand:- start:7798 stop:7974 length:177 start_codon:yes stop_codon:yes gene_type:complete